MTIIVLFVTDQPEIAAHPQNQTRIEGDNVTLSCSVDGNPVPTISWTRDGSPVNTSGTISISDDKKQLTISNVKRTDNGNYRCVANNSLGNATSNAATLNVQYPPEIAVHPEAETKSEGENVTLSCKADGNPVPTISWTRNGSPVGQSGRISFSADENQLRITNVKRTDNGNYRCVANNSLGVALSDAATVDVQYQPEIAAHPQNQTRIEGDNVTLSCSVDGNPVPTISWTRDGSPVNTSGTISISDDKKQLTISNVKRTDNGNYRCVANNSLGNATSNAATLNVQYPPEIAVHPEAETKSEGENVTLSCKADGNPVPTISWTRNGSPVGQSGRISFSADKKQLTITHVNRTDSGEFRCVASNSLGNDTSDASTVDIQYQPEIAAHPQNQTRIEGDNVTLSCSVDGNPVPTISWTRDGSPVNTSGTISISDDKKQLTISNVKRTDNGNYRCVANNSLGNATSNAATLNVQYPPEIAVHPEAETKSEGENVTLSCKADGNPVPTISWTRNGSPVGQSGRISFSADKKQLTITHVNRTDSGEFRCVASNSLGNDTSDASTVDIQCK
ncbi:roundabout homolog 1-like [Orbicella faveolata]|uniref:roundabout homolog 1-like n=1 Tax=Orbicella faveolata TaxID=48498 RepID=UPI0009E5B37C|nr:roundabout homolog 1-like [Orbicella faveolata]